MSEQINAFTPEETGIPASELRSFIERIDGPLISEIMKYLDHNEIWRPIPGYEGYFVSSWGNIKGKRVDELIQGTSRQGYKTASLSSGGQVTTVRISRVVLTSFVGPPPFDGVHAAHNDGDKNNNRLINLRWSTARENQADINRDGNRKNGSNVYGAKLVESDIPIIRQRLRFGHSQMDIASDFGVSNCTISLINLGKIWTHV